MARDCNFGKSCRGLWCAQKACVRLFVRQNFSFQCGTEIFASARAEIVGFLKVEKIARNICTERFQLDAFAACNSIGTGIWSQGFALLIEFCMQTFG